MTRAVAALSTILCFCLLSQAALAEKRVALVIGNSAYQNTSRLDNPVRDADAMRAILKDAGFDAVEFRRDLKATEMRRALRDFSDQARDADVAIVYFAGHGIEVDGMNYLVPTDAILERDIDTYDEAIALDRVLTVIEPARRLRLVILDACRDNPFSRTMKRTLASRAVGRGLAKVEPANPNTLIAFAAKAGSTASDGGGKNSPFTAALIRHLPKPGLDMRKAFGFTRDDVLKATNNKQEPFIYGSLGGDDYALVPAKPVAPAVAAGDVRRDYELALQVGTGSAWAAFLRAYPDGFYADLARVQLEKLAPAASAAPAKPDDEAAKSKDKAANEVASLTKADPAPGVSPAEITRRLQAELSRVGCYSGPADGSWSAAAQQSIALFNKAAGTRLDAKNPGADALDTLKSKTTRVCPLICDHGYKADGETCTRVTCAAGHEVGNDNTCRRIAPERPAARRDAPRPARPERAVQQPAPAPAPQATGRVFCDQGGCRPVPRGCQVIGTRTAADGRLVCN